MPSNNSDSRERGVFAGLAGVDLIFFAALGLISLGVFVGIMLT